MNDDGWSVPFGEAPANAPEWGYSSLTNVPKGYRDHDKDRRLITVICDTSCKARVGFVNGPLSELCFITWMTPPGGAMITGPLPGRRRKPETIWLGHFPLVRDGMPAPGKIRLRGHCPKHGHVIIPVGKLLDLAQHANPERPTNYTIRADRLPL